MKKIEAVEYALSINNDVKAVEKYNVSESIIRYWKTQLDKSKKASKNKDKITLHKGKKLTGETIETVALLLDLIKINSKIGIPITTISVKIRIIKNSARFIRTFITWNI